MSKKTKKLKPKKPIVQPATVNPDQPPPTTPPPTNPPPPEDEEEGG